MTIADADYSTAIELIREGLRSGTGVIDGTDLKFILGVLKDGADKQATSSSAADAMNTAYTAQMVILQAGGTGDISADVDTAQATLDPLMAAVVAANTRNPTYVSSAVADG